MNLNKIMKWFAIGVGALGILLGMIFYNLGNLDGSFWSLFVGSFCSVGAAITLEVK